MLDTEYNRVKKTKLFKDIVEDRAKVEILAVSWNVGTDVTSEGETVKVDIATENIEDLFDGAGRKIQGLHKDWWRERAAKLDPAGRTKVKLELFALCIDPEVPRKVEKAAQEQTQAWLKKHSAAIAKLDDERRAAYDEVRALAVESEITPLVHPATIEGKKSTKVWGKHLYIDENGGYPASFNKPETKFLEAETSRKDLIAWLRNTDRKPWALCIPYKKDGEDKAMYPDFLLVRKDGAGLVVDVAEPHEITFSDAPDKAAGLARFASLHADKFGRILLILLDGTDSKTLDLADEVVRAKVNGVKSTTELRKLFNET